MLINTQSYYKCFCGIYVKKSISMAICICTVVVIKKYFAEKKNELICVKCINICVCLPSPKVTSKPVEIDKPSENYL